jgi:hypothetical protein
MTGPSSNPERIITFRGRITDHDRSVLGIVASRGGYLFEEALVVPPREIGEDAVELPYHFADINDPHQFLCREHAVEFREGFVADDVDKRTAVAAFGKLVIPVTQYDFYRGTRPMPIVYGLEVTTRKEAGFPPFPWGVPANDFLRRKANLVVEVLGLIKLVNRSTDPGLGLPGIGDRSEYFLRRMVGQLEKQIAEAGNQATV